MQIPKRGAKGLADPHNPIFHPKSPFLMGQRPCGPGPPIPAPLDHGGFFPLEFVLRRLQW